MKKFFDRLPWQTVFAVCLGLFFLRNTLMPTGAETCLTWGGRTVAHIFVQLFVWKGHLLFDAANTLVFAAMVLLLFKAGTGLPLRELNKTYLLFILAGLYFCTPTPAITTIRLTGACNYLWMSTLIILFLLPFALTYRRKNFWSEASTGTTVAARLAR